MAKNNQTQRPQAAQGAAKTDSTRSKVVEKNLTVNEISREGNDFVLQVSGSVRIQPQTAEKRNKYLSMTVGSPIDLSSKDL